MSEKEMQIDMYARLLDPRPEKIDIEVRGLGEEVSEQVHGITLQIENMEIAFDDLWHPDHRHRALLVLAALKEACTQAEEVILAANKFYVDQQNRSPLQKLRDELKAALAQASHGIEAREIGERLAAEHAKKIEDLRRQIEQAEKGD